MRIRKTVIGEHFGRLTAIGEAADDANGKRQIVVRCECGEGRIVLLNNLRNGHTQSCGCLMRERTGEASQTHGHAGNATNRRKGVYNVWAGIVQRCTNRKSHNWPDYGGRGITMCDRWRHDYLAFATDMGPRPSMRHSIERRDNDGPYSPDNCQWATRVEQGRNRRVGRIFDMDDRPLGLLAMSQQVAMPESSLRVLLQRAGVLHAR